VERSPLGRGSRLSDHFLLLTCNLLLGYGHAARPLASARIGVCPLTSNRKPSAVAQTAVAADVHQSFDVHLNLLTQVALDPALLVDDGANAIDFFFGQLADASIDADARLTQYLVRPRAPYAVDVRQTDFSSFVSWQVDTCYACHSSSDCFEREAHPIRLPLPLFVLRVDADHPHHPTAVNNLAVLAHFLY